MRRKEGATRHIADVDVRVSKFPRLDTEFLGIDGLFSFFSFFNKTSVLLFYHLNKV